VQVISAQWQRLGEERPPLTPPKEGNLARDLSILSILSIFIINIFVKIGGKDTHFF